MTDWNGAGTKAGLEVWRIEKLVPTPVPTKMYGQFYDGDAYIVCKTTQRSGSSALDIDIHFWLGENVSQDEQGVAAYKTVELDEHLGGAAIQHREVQGYESEQFMQLFKKVEYLKGGVASGFTHVERDSYETRLLRLKGSRSVRVATMELSSASLNSGDVFVLDMGLKLIQWNGAEANRKEKAKALDVCLSIKDDERGGKATIDACEQGAEPEEFWTALGGKGPVAPAISDTVSDTAKGAKTVTLYKVSDATGAMTTTEVAKDALGKEMLDSNDVFILDNVSEIFVWVGKGASTDERKGGMKVGDDYCTKAGRPKGTRVVKVMEGCETTVFKSNFATWSVASSAPVDFSATPRGNVASTPRDRSSSDLVAGALRQKQEKQAEIDDANGKMEVFRLEDFAPVAVEESLFGCFYAGDTYIIKYTYEKNGKEQYLLYYWLGADSTSDEKGAAALHVTKMDDQLGGAATQVRVVMGKEPSHFVRCFKGTMVVHSGGKASGFKNRADADSYDMDGISLFQIRGNDDNDTHAVQVAEKAASLNSGDYFVLQTPTTCYKWAGGASNESEGETAAKVAAALQATRALEDVKEGAEPDAFWDALGGKGEYPSARVMPEGSREPMLFQCSNSTGSLAIDPVFDFSQTDLTEEDVFLLDSFTSLFVWVGSEANEAEKSGAKKAAAKYITAKGYDADTPVLTIKSGAEPSVFTCNFLGWDATKKVAFVDPYEAKLAALKAANPPAPAPSIPALKKVATPEPAPPPASGAAAAPDVSDADAPKKRGSLTSAAIFDKDFADPGSNYAFNYEQLKVPAEQLPKGVDPRKREQYLKDEDFIKALGSPRGEFESLKPWKQNQLKKAAGLF